MSRAAVISCQPLHILLGWLSDAVRVSAVLPSSFPLQPGTLFKIWAIGGEEESAARAWLDSQRICPLQESPSPQSDNPSSLPPRPAQSHDPEAVNRPQTFGSFDSRERSRTDSSDGAWSS